LAAVALTLVGCTGDAHAPQPAGPSPPAAISWADGSVIREGDARVDAGRTVMRYVTTTAGLVFSDTDGVVWSCTNGTATRVGHTPAHSFLSLAAHWPDGWTKDNRTRGFPSWS
jgi:hypothetical protein